jgi:hypothetical protein
VAGQIFQKGEISMSGLSLYQMTADYQKALSHLSEMDIDEQTLLDTLEGLQGELTAKAENVCAFTLNLEAEADAMKAAEKRIADRRRSLESKAKKMREYLLTNMQASGITEISANDKSFRIRVMKGSESVLIEDEAAIPVDYKRIIPETSAPDKTLIKKAIKDGYEVSGAKVVRTPSLKID